MSRRARRNIQARVEGVELNDLFTLFPALPPLRHRPPADQLRRVRENVERVQRRARASVAGQQAAAAGIRAAWLAKRRG